MIKVRKVKLQQSQVTKVQKVKLEVHQLVRLLLGQETQVHYPLDIFYVMDLQSAEPHMHLYSLLLELHTELVTVHQHSIFQT